MLGRKVRKQNSVLCYACVERARIGIRIMQPHINTTLPSSEIQAAFHYLKLVNEQVRSFFLLTLTSQVRLKMRGK
jgi:hypothetical protein